MPIVAIEIQKALALTRPNALRGAASTDPRVRMLLAPSGADLELVCADDTTETAFRIPGSVEAGVALAPQFADLVQTLAANVDIKLSPGKGVCKVHTGRSRFSVPCAPAADFPRFAAEQGGDMVTVTLNAASLAKAIQSVRYGIGKPEAAKAFTTGILVKASAQGVYLVATNSFKLVAVSIAGGTGAPDRTVEGVVPEMALAQIDRLARSLDGDDATIELRIGQRHAVASAGVVVIRSRLVACKFPDYTRVTAVAKPVTIQASRLQLVAVLKRVGLFVTDKSPFITVKVQDGKLTCSVTSSSGDCAESMDIEATTSVAAEHNMNISYLCSMLEAMPADLVHLDFGDAVLRVRGTGPVFNTVAVAAYYKA